MATKVLVNPINELFNLQREIDRMFAPQVRRNSDQSFGQDADNYYVEFLAPGLEPDGFEITLEKNVLKITGKRGEPARPEGTRYLRNERVRAEFEQRLRIPENVDRDSVKADYRNGILTLTLPKAPEAKPRQIQVSVQ